MGISHRKLARTTQEARSGFRCLGWDKAKGRSRVGWVTPTLIEAGAPSTEEVAKVSVVCPPHRG
jgi:hypothetical protein